MIVLNFLSFSETMASRQLFGKVLPSACRCKNLCNRTTESRHGCPCFTNQQYCSDSCLCGHDKMQCTNRVGKGGELDEVYEMILSEEEIEDNSDSDREDDPTVSSTIFF